MRQVFICSILTMCSLGYGQKLSPAKPQHELLVILEKVLSSKKLQRRLEIPLPEVRLESETRLIDFQNDIADQWGFRPELISNAYAAKVNRIYLLDDADYYKRHRRCLDDSLAHELVHYVQVQYQHYNFDDESLEWEAIDIQNELRPELCNQKSPLKIVRK